MDADAVRAALADSGLRTVAAGTALLGATAGAVGAFAVLRRQSLQGDVVSHAALPGLALAFLLGGRGPGWLVLGGAATGWLALVLVGAVTRRSRVPADAALGGALAVFYGLGLALMTYLHHHPEDFPGAGGNPLEKYLFGQATNLVGDDLWRIGGLGAGVSAALYALWKEFKLLAFDPDYAATLGYRVRLLDLLLTTLTVAAVAVGLEAVGVVLMTALLVAPAAAARQWSDRLGRVVLLAAGVGALSGAGGSVASHLAYQLTDRRVPTGPTIVLAATAAVAVSLLFGTARGLVWAWAGGRRG